MQIINKKKQRIIVFLLGVSCFMTAHSINFNLQPYGMSNYEIVKTTVASGNIGLMYYFKEKLLMGCVYVNIPLLNKLSIAIGTHILVNKAELALKVKYVWLPKWSVNFCIFKRLNSNAVYIGLEMSSQSEDLTGELSVGFPTAYIYQEHDLTKLSPQKQKERESQYIANCFWEGVANNSAQVDVNRINRYDTVDMFDIPKRSLITWEVEKLIDKIIESKPIELDIPETNYRIGSSATTGLPISLFHLLSKFQNIGDPSVMILPFTNITESLCLYKKFFSKAVCPTAIDSHAITANFNDHKQTLYDSNKIIYNKQEIQLQTGENCGAYTFFAVILTKIFGTTESAYHILLGLNNCFEAKFQNKNMILGILKKLLDYPTLSIYEQKKLNAELMNIKNKYINNSFSNKYNFGGLLRQILLENIPQLKQRDHKTECEQLLSYIKKIRLYYDPEIFLLLLDRANKATKKPYEENETSFEKEKATLMEVILNLDKIIDYHNNSINNPCLKYPEFERENHFKYRPKKQYTIEDAHKIIFIEPENPDHYYKECFLLLIDSLYKIAKNQEKG